MVGESGIGRLRNPLDFERELVELESRLDALKDELLAGDESKRAEYAALEQRVAKKRTEIYGKLTPYQRVQLSRHFDRPFTLDYVKYLITDFVELHGDRCFGDDAAVVGGTGRLGDLPVMVIGHQRGRTTTERLKRNFGMAQPEGYRKALRLFRLAEKFSLPLLLFIDTQGAFPGMEAEQRGQAEAIATNLIELAELTVPIISIIIGEGGSGGALALGIADRVLMLANACYSVISPEGCASILWPEAGDEPPIERAAMAAEALKVTAKELLDIGIIDEVVPEPAGGAHSNHKEAAELLRVSIVRQLDELSKTDVAEMVNRRYQKFRGMGKFQG